MLVDTAGAPSTDRRIAGSVAPGRPRRSTPRLSSKSYLCWSLHVGRGASTGPESASAYTATTKQWSTAFAREPREHPRLWTCYVPCSWFVLCSISPCQSYMWPARLTQLLMPSLVSACSSSGDLHRRHGASRTHSRLCCRIASNGRGGFLQRVRNRTGQQTGLLQCIQKFFSQTLFDFKRVVSHSSSPKFS